MSLKFLSLSNITLLTALTLSSIAAWFAIVGLVAIFPAKATAIIIMGGAIEVGKIVATVWLRKYWTRAGWRFKTILIPLVCILMFLTSMGTFGFLSAAHSEQSLASGDSSAQLAIIDEKIKTQRDNIELARKALQQMDAQVDARLARGDSESGAERAVQIRRQQAGERAKLQKEIADAQNTIAKLNEERAPLAAQFRKIEAEVGPIKYIAALVYDENPDSSTLERAVRWVIILLVSVLDPLAIALVLAGNSSKQWDREDEEKQKSVTVDSPPSPEPEQAPLSEPIDVTHMTPWPTVWSQHEEQSPVQSSSESETKAEEPFDFSKHPYLLKGGFGFKNDVPIQVYRPLTEPQVSRESPPHREVSLDTPIDTIATSVDNDKPIMTEGVTTETAPEFVETTPGYVIYDGKQMSIEALKGMRPELFVLRPDSEAVSTGFGTTFPRTAKRGDTWVRVDVLPNKLYKFDGSRWIEINKEASDGYIGNTAYIQYLIQKIDSGEYDVELLTDIERDQIAAYLRAQNTNL